MIEITNIPSDIKLSQPEVVDIKIEWPSVPSFNPYQPPNKPELRGVLIFNVPEDWVFRRDNGDVIKRLESMNIGCMVVQTNQPGATYVDLRK